MLNKSSMLFNIFFIIILNISLNANTLLDNYRLNGIQNIEKQMDLELTRSSYWEKYLQDKDTKFGYIENYSSILTCNKEKSTLSLYKKNNNNNFEFKKDYDAFTGKIKGDKIKEGDLKTPIGIYDITQKISKLDSFYGPLAFVTSYPNVFDTYRGKNGSGIWIHGLPSEEEREEFTKGCIAIKNSNIECLAKRIDINETLIIINDTEIKNKISKDKLVSIITQLYQWRYSWLYNNIDEYLKFYSSDFIRKDGMNLKKFKIYKKRVFSKNEKKTILFSNINIIPYPNTTNIFQITFKELYESRSFKFSGNKTLMVRVDKNNSLNIFTEK